MTHPRVPVDFERLPEEEMCARSLAFYERLSRRRSLRDFSPEPIPFEVVENAIRAAGTSPSGAHQQPWTFVTVTDPALKHEIRLAAEEEERLSYEGRMSPEWLRALEVIGTDWRKPHLDDAPVLIVVFEQAWGMGENGERVKHYYARESVGIAIGILLTALHEAGLATLTHTPSPMAFLSRVLDRPPNERALVVIPVGYPASGATVPALERKPLDAIHVRR
jgi:nitroreductase